MRQNNDLGTHAPLVHIKIASRLSNCDFCAFRNANKKIYKSLKAARVERAVDKLCQLVAYGKYAKAKALLDWAKNNDKALLEALLTHSNKTQINEYGVHKPKGTAYKIALMRLDVGMAKMFGEYFAEIDNGEALRQAQYIKVFPNGPEAHIAAQKPFDFSPIMDAISSASPQEAQEQLNLEDTGSQLNQAFIQFREAFDNVSEQEAIYNLTQLDKALERYDWQFDNMHPAWSQDQRRLFWRQVIGYVQRQMPTWLLQAHAQSLYCLFANNQPLKRSLEFSYGGGSIIDVNAVGVSGSDLGFEFAAGWEGESVACMEAGCSAGRRGWRMWGVVAISKIMSINTSELDELMPQRTRVSPPQPQIGSQLR